jgi:AcrR family transcriptional regulator
VVLIRGRGAPRPSFRAPSARLVTRARVSRKTFYEHFEDREGCFAAALEDVGEPRPVATFAPTGQETKSPMIRSLREGGEGGSPVGRARSRDMPGFRVTYRTVRVLEAITERPGASNREVAEYSGVADEGQIARMLARLEGLGVVERVGRRPARGEPNAVSWKPFESASVP